MDRIFEYEYISFDIFDTLLRRNVRCPEDVYDFVEVKYNSLYKFRIKNFRKKRIRAEYLARKKSDKEDITLKEIYNNLPYKDNVCSELMVIEQQMEIDLCSPNDNIVDLYNQCLEDGKKVIIISDMYLNRKTIKKMLYRIGIKTSENLFLSSEIGLTKQSGHLYDYVLKYFGIHASQMAHVGDNRKSDFVNAKERGIHAVWYNTEMMDISYWSEIRKCSKGEALSRNYLQSFLKNRLVCREGEKNNIGFSLIGPIVYNFCQWIHQQKRLEKFEKIIFVAREGYLPFLMYRKMFPKESEQVEYLRINKNILRLPMLYVDSSVDKFLGLIPYSESYYLRDILEFLGVAIIEGKENLIRDILNKFGFKEDTVVSREEMKGKNGLFEDFYEACVDFQRDEFQRQYNLLREYLVQSGIYNSKGKIALINNSINANAQSYLEKLNVSYGRNIQYWGVHFIISKEGRKKIGSRCSVWFDNKCSQFEKRLFYRNCLIFEHLLFENSGTAVSLEKTENGVSVNCEKYEKEISNTEIINNVAQNALKFVNEYRSGLQIGQSAKLNLRALSWFYQYPKKEDVLLIEKLVDYDYHSNGKGNVGDTGLTNISWVQGKYVTEGKSPILYNKYLRLELILNKLY